MCIFGDRRILVGDVELDGGCIVFISSSSKPFSDSLGVPSLGSCSLSLSCVCILSSICLQIIPISDFVVLINRCDGLVLKFSLWSLIVIKAGCLAIEFILWSMFNFVAISLASLFKLFIVISGAFSYICVLLFVIWFLKFVKFVEYEFVLSAKISIFWVVYSFSVIYDVFRKIDQMFREFNVFDHIR